MQADDNRELFVTLAHPEFHVCTVLQFDCESCCSPFFVFSVEWLQPYHTSFRNVNIIAVRHMDFLAFLQKGQVFQLAIGVSILSVVIRLTARKPLAGTAFAVRHNLGFKQKGRAANMSHRAL